MRNPLRKTALYLLCVVIGGAMLLALALGAFPPDSTGRMVAIFAGVFLVPMPAVLGLMSGLAAIGEMRLRAGRNVIARWHVDAAEWDRFRAADAARAAEHPSLINDMRIRSVTPPAGVDVVVGRRQLMMDGSYQMLRRHGLPELRWVGWIAPPGGPECLEFRLVYPRGRFGGFLYTTLRVPVAPAARDDGVRVYHHYHALIPAPRPSLAERYPLRITLGGLGLTLLALTVAGIGWLMVRAGNTGDLPPVLMIIGIMTALGAALVTIIVALVVQPWRKG